MYLLVEQSSKFYAFYTDLQKTDSIEIVSIAMVETTMLPATRAR